MALGDGFWLWALSRYLGGLWGGGMLLGSGLVQGWLLRHGHRPELGVHFMGLGLGVAVSALGAMGMQALHFDWAAQWWGFAVLGLAFCCRPGLGGRRCRRRCWPAPSRRHRAAGCG